MSATHRKYCQKRHRIKGYSKSKYKRIYKSKIEIVEVFRSIINRLIISMSAAFIAYFFSLFLWVIKVQYFIKLLASETCLSLHSSSLFSVSHCFSIFCLFFLFISKKLFSQFAYTLFAFHLILFII